MSEAPNSSPRSLFAEGAGIMLPSLTEAEQTHLRDVLERAEKIQRQDEWRKVRLRNSSTVDLAGLHASVVNPERLSSNECTCCGASLMWLLNPSKQCDFCGQATCRSCSKAFYGGSQQLCLFCFVDVKYRLESGAWFYARRAKADRTQQLAIEELREALTRAPSPAETARRRDVSRSPQTSPRAANDRHCSGPASAVPAIVIEADQSPPSSGRSTPRGGAGYLIWRRKKGHDRTRSSSASTDLSDPESLNPSSIASSRVSSLSPSESATEKLAGGTSVSSTASEAPDLLLLAVGLQGSEEGLLNVPLTRVSQQSLVSLYSLADDNFDLPDGAMASGDVQLGLQFDRKKSCLRVAVLQCRNLLAYVKAKRSSDPFVKVYLLPDKTRAAKRKTSHRKGTLSPVFNETFKYRVEPDDLETRSVWLTVWHHSRLGHNAFLGEALVPLIDVRLDDPAPQWYPLHEKREIDLPSPHLIYKGDLSVAVKHVPLEEIRMVGMLQEESRGELHVWIKDAKNLIPTHSNGYSNPFAKVLLLPDRSKKGKRKTEVIHKTLSPSWNTVLRFENVAAVELEERSLEITVWDRSRLRANEFLGGVRLNLGKGVHAGQPVKWMHASGYEVTLWRAVIQRPGQWVEGCLALRAHMD